MEMRQHLLKFQPSRGASRVSRSPTAPLGTCRQRKGGGQKSPRSAEPSGVPCLGVGMFASGPRVAWHEAGQGNSVALMPRLMVEVDCSDEGLEGACRVG